jgi:hypothetical protein
MPRDAGKVVVAIAPPHDDAEREREHQRGQQARR